jgi:transcriptional regulator with XRE-family HTH domain
VERGVNAPTLARLKNIADAIGVEVWQLFYPKIGEEVPRRSAVKKSPGRRGPGKRRSSR